MKRIILAAAVILILVDTSWAAPARSVINAESVTKDTVFLVGTTDILYTKSLDMKDVDNGQDVGILYKATSNGTVNIRLDMQTSYKPSTNGLADTDYMDSHVIDTSITDEVWYLVTVDTVILPYARFKVTGQGSNDASTTFEIKVSK